MAAGGEAGVAAVLDILRAEIQRTLILMGCGDVTQLSPEWLIDTQKDVQA
ncbi:alpha-hydroxy-acid oxidizing protein [Mangrovimicrobium sediminis]